MDGQVTVRLPNRELLLRGRPRGLVSDHTASRTTLDELASVPARLV